MYPARFIKCTRAGVSVDIYPSTENQFTNDEPYQIFLLDKLDVRELSYTRNASLLVG